MRHFQCVYSVDASTHARPATRIGDLIHCDELRFEYFSRGNGNGTANADFQLLWWPDSATTTRKGAAVAAKTRGGSNEGVGGLIAAALSGGRGESSNVAATDDDEATGSKAAGTVLVGPGNRLDNEDNFTVSKHLYLTRKRKQTVKNTKIPLTRHIKAAAKLFNVRFKACNRSPQ